MSFFNFRPGAPPPAPQGNPYARAGAAAMGGRPQMMGAGPAQQPAQGRPTQGLASAAGAAMGGRPTQGLAGGNPYARAGAAPQGNPYARAGAAATGGRPTMGLEGHGQPQGSAFSRSAGMLMSDESSKRKIAELEGQLEGTYRALGGGHAPAPTPKQPDTAAMDRATQAAGQGALTQGDADHVAALDRAYRQPGSYSYEYKDPSMPGAAPGRHVGPMAHELRSIPGVVERTPNGEAVNTGRLSLANASEVANQRRELDELRAQMAALGAEADAVHPTYPTPTTPRY